MSKLDRDDFNKMCREYNEVDVSLHARARAQQRGISLGDARLAASYAGGGSGGVVAPTVRSGGGAKVLKTVFVAHESKRAARLVEIKAASSARVDVGGYAGHVIGKGGRVISDLSARFTVEIFVEDDTAFILRPKKSEPGAPDIAGARAAVERIVADCKAQDARKVNSAAGREAVVPVAPVGPGTS